MTCNLDGKLEVLKDGWVRVSIVVQNQGSQVVFFGIRPSGMGAPGTGYVYAWGAQVEEGSAPSSYIPTTSAAQTRGADTLRADMSAGAAYFHEKGRSADGGKFAWHIETADTFLDPERGLLVREIWPDFKGQMGAVGVTLTSRLEPQAPEQATSVAMAPGQAKADVLATGRLFRLRFSGESTPTSCRIGKPVFDVAPTGLR